MQEKDARAARAKEGRQSSVPLGAEPSQQSSEWLSSPPGISHPPSSAAHSSQPRPGIASVRPASAASQEQPLVQQTPAAAASRPPMQQTPVAAARQPMAQQTPKTQQAPTAQQVVYPKLASQPIAVTTPAALQAAVGSGVTVSLHGGPQPGAQAALPSRPASAGPAGLTVALQQQNSASDGSQPEGGLSQAAGGSSGGGSRRSEAEHAENLNQAIKAAASYGADRNQLNSLVKLFKRGSAKAIVNEVHFL